MTSINLNKDVRSFVSFALAMKPSVVIHNAHLPEDQPEESIEVRLSEDRTLSQREVTSLESLIAKYEPLRKYLHRNGQTILSSISEEVPQVRFEPNVEYRLVSIEAEQLAIAQEVASRVERTYSFHTAGDQDAARSEYDSLQDYLEQQRAAFIGDFADVPEFREAIGLVGVGRNGSPQADLQVANPIIFVVIEIYLS